MPTTTTPPWCACFMDCTVAVAHEAWSHFIPAMRGNPGDQLGSIWHWRQPGWCWDPYWDPYIQCGLVNRQAICVCLVCVYYYSDIIMNVVAFHTTGVSIVYSTLCSGVDKRKRQSSVTWLMNSPHKSSVMWKMLPFDDVIKFLVVCRFMWFMDLYSMSPVNMP